MLRRLFLSLAALPLLALIATAADKMTFEIYADAKDEFRWRLLDGEKNIANSGQGYAKKADCKKMVDNFVDDISKYKFETYKDNKMEYRFRMLAKNGNNVGASTSGYEKEADIKKVIEAIEKGAKGASVKEFEKKDDKKKP